VSPPDPQDRTGREWLSAAAFLAVCVLLYTALGLVADATGQDWTHLWELDLR
jgi:hypothetical protein